jgi:hypothetical protein
MPKYAPIGGEPMKREAIFPMACLILVLSLLPSPLKAQYEFSEVKTGKKRLGNVLILPSEASLVKVGMKGAEPMVAESHVLESGLSSVVRETLAARGCTILQDAFGQSALDQNPDLKYALADLQSRYDKLQVLLKKKPKDVRKGRFTMGDEVANFNPGAAADALVFVRASGVLETNGRKTFVLLTGMGVLYNHVMLDISIVDAQTGTVLYFAKPGAGGDFVGNPDSMKQSIVNSFSELRAQ